MNAAREGEVTCWTHEGTAAPALLSGLDLRMLHAHHPRAHRRVISDRGRSRNLGRRYCDIAPLQLCSRRIQRLRLPVVGRLKHIEQLNVSLLSHFSRQLRLNWWQVPFRLRHRRRLAALRRNGCWIFHVAKWVTWRI